MWDTFGIWIARIIGEVGVAFGAFVWFGKRFIENWFKKDLEDYRHRQNQELEQLRYKINSLFDRVTKIHDKEFEVLPIGWRKLQDALGDSSHIVSPIKKYPQLNRMSEQQVKDFLNKSDLTNYDKEQLLGVEDKEKFYEERIFWYELDRAEKSLTDFHNYLLYNKIFLDSDLFVQCKKMDDLLYNALSSSEIGRKAQDHNLVVEAYNEIKEKADPLAKEIEKLVQKRLHYKEAE